MFTKNVRPKSFVLLIVLMFSLGIANVALANTVSLDFEDAEYRDIFQTLGELGHLNVFIDDSVVGRGSLKLSNITITQALDLVSELSGYSYRVRDGNLLVGTKERLAQYEQREIRYVYTRYVSNQAIIPALSMVISSNQIYAQPGTNLIVLSGTQEELDHAEQVIAKLDQPAKLTMQEQRTILSILQEITQELNLDLIADPKLAEETIVLNAWQMDPWDVLRTLEELSFIDVQIHEDTLVASQIDAVGKEKIKVYRLYHRDPEAVANAITLILPSTQIQIDEKSQSVVVRASDRILREIDEFVDAYDQPLPQVFMEVWIQEMSSDVLQTLGVEWANRYDGLVRVNKEEGGLAVFELDLEPWEINFVLRALEEEGKVRVLASPKLATLSGQEATMFVGDRVPIVLVDDEGRERLEFLESGISLRVLPQVGEDGYITISVRPEASTFAYTTGSTYPTIRTREAETTIRVKDGQPVLIGGLLQEQENESASKLPILGQLPILGSLFSSTTTDNSETDMNIFLIPRIVTGAEGLISQSMFTSDPELSKQILNIPKKKPIDSWFSAYYVYGSWQLQAGFTSKIQFVGLSLGLQYSMDGEFRLLTDAGLYASNGNNVRVEASIPVTFDRSELAIGIGFGLPFKYQSVNVEPNAGLYIMGDELQGRIGIRLVK